MSTKPFLQPELKGARFDGGMIPLEFLKDLAVLEEMIIEVAKSEFLKDHPDRQRSPRGFTEGIALKLTGIGEGSAVPEISLCIDAPTLLPDENEIYFQRARDAIAGVVSAAEQNESMTDHLPERMLGYFDRIGRSLRDDEAIEFPVAGRATPARLTKDTRRKLVLASAKLQELTEEHSVRGTVPEADQDDMTFEVQLSDGRKIGSPITAQHLDTIIEAFDGYKMGARVLLQGIGRFNRNDRLLSFDSIEHVSLLEPLDIPARLDELRALKDGWLEGQAQAPPQEKLDWLSQTFGLRYPDNLRLPFLYPTADGGIQAEWSLGPNEITLEIDLDGHTGRWHVLNMDTDAEESRTLALDDAVEWQWLIGQIQHMGGGAS